MKRCHSEESIDVTDSNDEDWQGYIEGVIDHINERITELAGKLEEFGTELEKLKSTKEDSIFSMELPSTASE